MKVLLAAVNAKYIHSNLAVHSLKAYARTYTEEIEVAEYTINQTFDAVSYTHLPPVLIRKPDLFRQDYYYREYEHPNKLYKMAICSTEKEIAADIDMELKL